MSSRKRTEDISIPIPLIACIEFKRQTNLNHLEENNTKEIHTCARHESLCHVWKNKPPTLIAHCHVDSTLNTLEGRQSEKFFVIC